MLYFLGRRIFSSRIPHNRVQSDSFGIWVLWIPFSTEASSEKREIVTSLLNNYGFNDTQLPKIARVSPWIFSANPIKILVPKLEFFLSIGVSGAELPRILTANSVLLGSSLEKRLIPNYDFFKNIVLSDEIVPKIFKRAPRLLTMQLERTVSPNIELLRQLGVPRNFLMYLLTVYPSVVHKNPEKFKRGVDKAIKMGFNPSKSKFVQAVQVFNRLPKSTWDDKVAVFKRCGLSNDECLELFRSRPTCMCVSKEKIARVMDFLVNTMKLPPTALLQCPTILTLDLEKRVIPRGRVIKLLIAKGLVTENVSLCFYLLVVEGTFLSRFVFNYENKLPGLVKIYQGEAETPVS